MRKHVRIIGAALLVAGGGLVASACGGSSSPDRDPMATASMAGQAEMPSSARSSDELFRRADDAFHSGEYALAQRFFGELHIVDPGYRSELPGEALEVTCDRLDNDCSFVLPRLDFIRGAFEGRYDGPRSGWHPEQERDYQRIKECYDRAIMGDFRAAVDVGSPVTGAPLPAFSAAARDCVSRSQTVVEERRQQERAEEALQAWHANYPCLDSYRRQLLLAADQEDWEEFAQIFPQYDQCAQVIQDIVDDGVLAGDPRLGMQHDLAFTQLSEVEFILEDYEAEIEAAMRGSSQLRNDPGYNQRIEEYRSLSGQIADMDNRIRSLRSAMGAVSGAEQENLQRQVSSMEQARASLVARQDSLRDELNNMRVNAGLAPRNSFD